jgi:hypothetical protein
MSTKADWFSENPLDCEQDPAVNAHMGAEGAIYPSRVHDPEEAKTLVLSYKTSAEATTAIIKRRFQITWYPESDTCRLRVDLVLTTIITEGAHSKANKILIYDAYVHP